MVSLVTFAFSDIDDIVLSYVNGILEDLVEEANPEHSFDSEDFLEMILAYLPQLEGIDVSSMLTLEPYSKYNFRINESQSG